MRLAFLVLVAIVPLDACSDTFVTAPPPMVPLPKIVIRGAQTPGRPLMFVDGVPVRISDIDPADIEQVEVVKGAAAAALYGAETRCPPIIVRTR